MSINSRNIVKFRQALKGKNLSDYRGFLSQLSKYFLDIDSDSVDKLVITEAEKTLKEIYNYNFVDHAESSKFDLALKGKFRSVRGTVSGLAQRIKSRDKNPEEFYDKAIALGEELKNLVRLLSLTAAVNPLIIEWIEKIATG